jgi:hypothetical protein
MSAGFLGLHFPWITKTAAQESVGKTPKMAPSELLLHSTVQIISETTLGAASFGTGFFFAFFPQGNQNVPAIVTNKHVVAGATTGHLKLTMQSADGSVDLNNFVDFIVPDFAIHWIPHPDPAVDLTVMPCAGLLQQLENQGKKAFLVTLDQSLVPTDADLAELTPLEDILVVGYPNGIIDKAHNIPVFRRGITATPANIDFNNTTEFLIDAAIFPGSSGSPVLLFNQGSYATRQGLVIGSRVKLLGIVHAVFNDLVNGEISIVPAPTQARAVVNSAVPNNLGVCIKASRVLEFEPVFVQRGFKPPDGYKMRAGSSPP